VMSILFATCLNGETSLCWMAFDGHDPHHCLDCGRFSLDIKEQTPMNKKIIAEEIARSYDPSWKHVRNNFDHIRISNSRQRNSKME